MMHHIPHVLGLRRDGRQRLQEGQVLQRGDLAQLVLLEALLQLCRSQLADRALQPLVQIDASVPATAIFPVLLLLLVRGGGSLGFSSVLLMLLGTGIVLLVEPPVRAAVDRSAVPQPVRTSREFQGACPASAIVMRLDACQVRGEGQATKDCPIDCEE